MHDLFVMAKFLFNSMTTLAQFLFNQPSLLKLLENGADSPNEIFGQRFFLSVA